MNVFVTAIPLFDPHMSVEAYRIAMHNGERLLGLAEDHQSMGDMLLTPALDILEEIGIEPFASDKALFVDINPYQLLMGAPLNKRIDSSRLVCVLSQETPADAATMEKCARLKAAKARIAYCVPRRAFVKNALTDIADYFIVDHLRTEASVMQNMPRHMTRGQRLIIENVSDMPAFQRYGNMSRTMFSGKFYNQPVTLGKSKIAPVKVNALNLMRQTAAADVDLISVARTIERDPALSISLLRFINSPAVNVKRHIESIRGAVAILGTKELQRWVTVALSISLAEDRPGEITKLSLVRAKFAENLATVFEMGALAQGLFMAGLFSLLDVILQKPMDEAIQEVAVDKGVRETLVERKGKMYEVLDFIYAHERADWDGVSINIIRNNIDPAAARAAYIDALEWYRQLLEDIDENALAAQEGT